jgi:hypothetical protein
MLTGLSILTIASPEFNVVEAAIVVAFTVCTHEAINFKPKSGRPQLSEWVWERDKVLPILVFAAQFGLSSYSIWFWFRG